MKPFRALMIIAVLGQLTLAAQARTRDEEEAPWVGIVERIESCLAEQRPILTQGQACIGIHWTACLRRAENQTTIGMERCYLDEYRAWDGLLNRYWRQRPTDQRGEALQQVQRAWLRYRDSKCAYFRVHHHGGSIARWLGAHCMAETTARRAIELRYFRDDARSMAGQAALASLQDRLGPRVLEALGGRLAGLGEGFLAHLQSPGGYEEPEILRYTDTPDCLRGADVGHSVTSRPSDLALHV